MVESTAQRAADLNYEASVPQLSERVVKVRSPRPMRVDLSYEESVPPPSERSS
ncbi:hypothetical protein KT71_003756 [Congregibacter litoralis KT71]|uniref:Uncharacterized protein n=1 Tax=Congregibacter litoralis KT71 TaxID=314285 RepID=V7HUS6_9GAMM|nr:hypothetical protein KT71_003756 [Congregibacter litoralis KT71]